MYEWYEINSDIDYPKAEQPVLIWISYGEGLANVFTAHHVQRVWYMWDEFTERFRVIPNQDRIKKWSFLPAEKKRIVLL